MQCPCGAECVHQSHEVKKAETVSEWAQKEIECESGKIDQWKCKECGRIRRTVYNQDSEIVAQFG